MDELLGFIRTAKADLSEFDAKKLKGMMEGLHDPLVRTTTCFIELKSDLYILQFEHMDAEVIHIEPENLKGFEGADLLWLDEQLSQHAKTHSDPFTVLPFMRRYVQYEFPAQYGNGTTHTGISHTPPEFKDSWPPLPWFLRKILVPYVFGMYYSG